MEDARAAIKEGDRARAVTLLEAVDTPAAKTLLGELVEPDDPKRAASLYREAAEAGHAAAKYRLALCYRDGRGTPRYRPKFEKLIDEAAAMGHPDAEYVVAVRWIAESPEHPDRGLLKLLELANNGHQAARIYVASVMIGEEAISDFIPAFRDLPGDYIRLLRSNEHVKWIQESAQRGDPDAQFLAALRAERNSPEELDWLRKAAAQGNVAAQVTLARRLDHLRSTRAELEQARDWAMKAAVAGEPLGALELHGLLMKLNGDWSEWYPWLLVYKRMEIELGNKKRWEQRSHYTDRQALGSERQLPKARNRAKQFWKLVRDGVAARKEKAD